MRRSRRVAGRMAPALHEVGLAIAAGQFARAESLLAQRRSTDERAGAGGSADVVELVRAFNQMHLGHYERARAMTMACLARFRETGYQWGMRALLLLPGLRRTGDRCLWRGPALAAGIDRPLSRDQTAGPPRPGLRPPGSGRPGIGQCLPRRGSTSAKRCA